MKEEITLGPTPSSENCVQTTDPDYAVKARKECTVYRSQLMRLLVVNNKEVTEGFSLRIKGHAHDFGTYYEVAACYDIDDEKACKLAFWLDENTPQEWDEEARKELGK